MRLKKQLNELAGSYGFVAVWDENADHTYEMTIIGYGISITFKVLNLESICRLSRSRMLHFAIINPRKWNRVQFFESLESFEAAAGLMACTMDVA